MANEERVYQPHQIEWDEAKTQHLWDYYSTSDAHRSTYFGETCGKHFVRILGRKGVFRSRKVIVDFSCGTGAIVEAILGVIPSNALVFGYDLSVRSVEKTNARNQGKTGFGGARSIDAYPTSIASGSIDLLILTEVIEHLDDLSLSTVLAEIHRVLAPSGRLVLTTPNDEVLERAEVICPECGCTFHRWQHCRTWKGETLAACLRNSGFSQVKIRTVTWGDELIDLAFSVLRRKKTGLLALATKE